MRIEARILLLLFIICINSVKSQGKTNNSYIKNDGKKVEVKTSISKMKLPEIEESELNVYQYAGIPQDGIIQTVTCLVS